MGVLYATVIFVDRAYEFYPLLLSASGSMKPPNYAPLLEQAARNRLRWSCVSTHRAISEACRRPSMVGAGPCNDRGAPFQFDYALFALALYLWPVSLPPAMIG